MAATTVFSPSAVMLDGGGGRGGDDGGGPLGLMCCFGVDGAFDVPPATASAAESPWSSFSWGHFAPAQTEPSSGEASEAQWPQPAKATEILPPGLPNLGNTCYLNSAVQMLASLEHFVGDVVESYSATPCGGVCSCWEYEDSDAAAAAEERSGRGSEEFDSSVLVRDGVADVVTPSATARNRGAGEDDRAVTSSAAAVSAETAGGGGSDDSMKSSSSRESSKDKPLRDAFARVVSALRSPPPSPSSSSSSGRGSAAQAIDPRALKSAVGAAAPLFAGYAQQDSHEFLSALLDLLHDEMRAPPPEAELEAVEEEEEEEETEGGEEEKEEISKNTERAAAEAVRDSAAGADSANGDNGPANRHDCPAGSDDSTADADGVDSRQPSKIPINKVSNKEGPNVSQKDDAETERGCADASWLRPNGERARADDRKDGGASTPLTRVHGSMSSLPPLPPPPSPPCAVEVRLSQSAGSVGAFEVRTVMELARLASRPQPRNEKAGTDNRQHGGADVGARMDTATPPTRGHARTSTPPLPLPPPPSPPCAVEARRSRTAGTGGGTCEARTVTECARLVSVGAFGAREVRTVTELARLVGGGAHAEGRAPDQAPALWRTGDDRDSGGGAAAAATMTAGSVADIWSDVPSEAGGCVGGIVPIRSRASSMCRSESCEACGRRRRRRRSAATAAAAGTTPVEVHFATKVRLRLTCDSCGSARDRTETHRHLSLEVRGSTTVEDGLKRFFATETVEVNCENEKCDGRSATQTAEIVRLPRAMLLHFKRFIMDISPDYSRITYRKDHSPVRFPQVLKLGSDGEEEREEEADDGEAVTSLAEFLAPDASVLPPLSPTLKDKGVDLRKKHRRRMYRLRSVVHHIGQSANRGHYMADAYRTSGCGGVAPSSSSGGAWMRFNDAAVSRVEAKDVVGESARRTAYMVLYELD